MRLRPTVVALLAGLALASACSSGEGSDILRATPGSMPATSAPAEAPTTTTTTAAQLPPAAPPTATAPSCPPLPARAEPRADRTRHVHALRVDLMGAGTVSGRTEAVFTPDITTDQIVVRLWAAGGRAATEGSRVDVGKVELRGKPVTTERPSPTVLILRTGNLLAGKEVPLVIEWTLHLPEGGTDRIARHGTSVRLGTFLPVIAWEPGVGWQSDPPTSGFAEASMLPVGDHRFTVDVSQPGLTVLATGVQQPDGTWEAVAVRDVAMSIGDFRMATRTAHAPHPVSVAVGVAPGLPESPDRYADKIVKVLADLSARFGSYPWPSVSFSITPDLGGGIEHPMHVLQGPGTIGRTTSHELAHFWFHGLVGNHQGRDPWIDEGLSTYGEGRAEGSMEALRAKDIPAVGLGRIGEPMAYWDRHPSAYYRSIYVQGAMAVATLGPLEVVDCALAHLVAREAHAVATNADVIEALSVVFPQAREHLAKFGVRT